MAGSDTLIGQIISHYRIVERLGDQGVGVVYKADETALNRFVALKFLPDDLAKDAQALERLRREAKAASALNHPKYLHHLRNRRPRWKTLPPWSIRKARTLKHVISRRPMELERMLTVAIDVALPNEGDKDHYHQSSNSSRYDVSRSQPGTPAADIAIKAGVASN